MTNKTEYRKNYDYLTDAELRSEERIIQDFGFDLKILAEHWAKSSRDDMTFPDNARNLSCISANNLGKDILNLFERVEKLENIINEITNQKQ
jgi:hypothetical protein